MIVEVKIVTTGQRIKSVREQAGMTQVELANKLNISYQSIGQWERDIRTPKQSTLTKIAKALGVHLRDLADTSIWEEFDKQYPNLGKESTELKHSLNLSAILSNLFLWGKKGKVLPPN